VLSLDVQPARATTFNVPGNFATIQDAINHVNAGAVIYVSAGVYEENIVVNKSVALIGDNQKAQITGTLSDSVRVEADNVTFMGFNISVPDSCRGIVVASASHVTICGNLIDGMTWAEGIVISGGGSHSIVNNQVEVLASGIGIWNSANNLIMGNDVFAWEPVCLGNCSQNYIVKNWICRSGVGSNPDVWLHWCNDSTIEQNTFTCLGTLYEATVYLSDSTNSLFFHNSFENVGWTSAVLTFGNTSSTLWDNGSEGNYWMGYEVDDLNGDGIGDTPYVVNENFTDYYPLMQPYSWWNPCDINGDFTVNIFDIVLLCGHYGSTAADSEWNWLCDIAEPYGKIDIFDLVMIASRYGEEYVP
jgi:nitrous oxidase accessory protein NosD